MKKTYVLTIEYDEEKVKGDSNLPQALDISEERGKELLFRCEKDQKAEHERGNDCFNSLTATLDLLESGELTGNEILLYISSGYAAAMNARRMFAQKSSLAGLMGMMGKE